MTANELIEKWKDCRCECGKLARMCEVLMDDIGCDRWVQKRPTDKPWYNEDCRMRNPDNQESWCSGCVALAECERIAGGIEQ